MIIGEQPGDVEDIEGKPFLGPAGLLLDEALRKAGIDRDEIYLTNAVKHFKWKPAPGHNKRRIHDRANAGEISMCKPWLIAEVMKVKPRTIITLGNTAAQSIIDPHFRILESRGKITAENSIEFSGTIIATIHPAYLLRNGGKEERGMTDFIADLQLAVTMR